MEPKFTALSHLLSVEAELRAREPIFHRPEFGTTRADFERMTDANFWEVGASGRRYSREYVIANLVKRYSSPQTDRWEVQDFYCADLGGGLYQTAYTLIQDNMRVTRRMTLWRREPDGWRIAYHQGTVVEDPTSGAAV